MTLDQFKAMLLRHMPGHGPRSAWAIARAAAALGEPADRALTRRPMAEDVISAFRLILGRDPDLAQVAEFMKLPTVTAVSRELTSSQEFKDWFTRDKQIPREHPDAERSRPATVYLHLSKTGGTSLRHELARHFTPDRICPLYWNTLHQLTVADLGHYDLFQGHYDFASLRFIPRDNIRVISMFREPRSRMISGWRALRAFPMPENPDIEAPNPAQRMGIEEFYEHPDIRASVDLHNYYLMVFGFSPSWIGSSRPSLPTRSDRIANMENARNNIRALAAIGLTERFDQSVRLICKVLGLPSPELVEARNVTDLKPSYDARFSRVERVVPTPRLDNALAELIEFDDELYRFAVAEFERRCAEHDIH